MQDLTSGACLGHDPVIWETVTRHGRTARLGSVLIDGVKVPRIKQIYLAKSICSSCPVQKACLEAGMDEPEMIWGGLLPDERMRVL